MASSVGSVYAHSLAAARYQRRALSIDCSAEEPAASKAAQADAAAVDAGEQKSRTRAGSERGESGRGHHQPSASLSLSVSTSAADGRPRGLSLLSPHSASAACEPQSAPIRHRRSLSSLPSSSASLHSPSPRSPRSPHSPASASSAYPKRQKKPKAGPILNSSSSSSSRLFLDVNDSPAPGSYRSYSAFTANPSKGVRMHERIQHKEGSCAPGPGTYEPQTTAEGTAVVSGQRLSVSAPQGQGWALAPSRDTATALLAGNDTAAAHLGPAAYSIPSSIGTGPAAAIRSRPDIKDPLAHNPAPGAYEVAAAAPSSSSAVSMALGVGRSALFPTAASAAELPAPGSYDVPSQLGVSAPSASIRSRLSVVDAHAGGAAVGQYSGAHASTLGRSSQGVSMDGRVGRSELWSDVVGDPAAPAPGAYDAPALMGTGRAASIRSRLEVADVHAGGAAPGQYDGAHLSTLHSTGGMAMDGQAARSELWASANRSEAPAPGSYEVVSSIGQGPAATLRSRLVEVDVHAALPAPGQYDGAHASTLSTEHGTSMSKQVARQELFAVDHQQPAPGHYTLPDTLGQAPAATLRSRVEVKDPPAAVPGVGSYGGAYVSTLGSGASAASMDGSARPELFPSVGDSQACVGAYNLPSLIGQGPAAAIRSRIEAPLVHAGGAAPGQYDGALQSTLLTSHAAAVSMDRGSERGELFHIDSSGPAVGQYSSTHRQMGTEGPSASIRSRLELRDPHALNPAPGAYEVAAAAPSSSSAVSMALGVGRSALFPTAASAAELPAPGSYDVPSQLGVSAPSASIRSRLSVVDAHAGGAAVGQYSGAHASTLGRSSQGVSMDGRVGRSELWSDVVGDPAAPAPGAYDAPALMGTGRAASIRSRLEVADVHAGGAAPGQYDGAHLSTLHSTGGMAMDGQAARSELWASANRSEAPAPGSYEVVSSIGQGPAATLRSRLVEVDVHAALPAPGQYDGAHASTLSTEHGTSMSKQVARQELFAVDHQQPAPGHYTLPDTLGQAPAATLRSRVEVKDPPAAVPGVGSYGGAYVSTLGSGASAASMDGSARPELFPSVGDSQACVGAYNLPSLIGQGPAAAIRSRIEAPLVHAGGAAPGQYDGALQSTLLTSHAAAVSMDRGSERGELFHIDSSGPAVGQYSSTHRQMGTEGPSASIRSRLELRDPHALNPAPGAYEVAAAAPSSSSAVSMALGVGRSALFPTAASAAELPAPGSYDVPSQLGVSAPSASIRSRLSVVDAHAGGAAVGQYSGAHASTLGRSSQGVSMDGRVGRSELWSDVVGDPAAPAPGAYDAPALMGTGRAASIRSRLEVADVHAGGAAPGQYDGAHLSTLHSTGGMAMDGQAARSELWASANRSEAPAPGSYEVVSSIGQGPAATLRSRLVEVDVHAALPAPGQYDGAHASTLSTEHGTSMSKQVARQELFAVDHQQPAPGHYTLPDTLGQAPAATLRSRLDLQDPHAHVPGVGSYEVAASSVERSGVSADMAKGSGRRELFDELTSAASALPAPGQYALPSLLGQAPAASIRSRLQLADPRAAVPGVGSYDVRVDGLSTSTRSQGAVAMLGQLARPQLFSPSSDAPAPGAYDTPDDMGQGPSATLRSRTMDPLQVGATVTPAPTAYDAHGGVGTQAAGGAQLGFAQQSGRKELHPVNADTALLAPGSYDTPDTWGQGRAATITARTLDPLRVGATVTPAPGSYDVNQQHHSSAQGQPSFGLQSGRAELFTVNHQQPAPGQYTLPDTIGQGPAASMRSRTEVADQRLQYPGVGSYSPEAASSSSSASSAVSMAASSGRAAELFPTNKDTAAVAPGSYSLPAVLGVGAAAASIRSRLPVRDAHMGEPAPGSYSPEQFEAMGQGAPAVRMRGYSERAEDVFEHTHTESQGPAAYDVRQGGIGQAAPKHSIGVRRELRDERVEYPAPGAYDTAASTASTAAAHVSMNTQSARKDLWGQDDSGREQQPAPGQYELPSSMGQGPAAAIRSRVEVRDERSSFPAVGAYEAYSSTLTAAGSSAYDMARGSQRLELFAADADSPAPGSYEVVSSIGQGPAATLRSRLVEVDVHAALPAPGQYDGAHASTLSTEHGTSMSKQVARQELFAVDHQQPAPGHYTLPDTLGQAPAATLRSRLDLQDPHAHVPGVGSYEVAASSVERSGVSADMAKGSGRRELFDELTSAASALPAPGQYALPSLLGQAPAASIRSRLQLADPRAAVPGVGSYDVRVDGLSTSTRSQGAVAMLGQLARPQLFSPSSDAPAPGAYDTPDDMGQGPSATLRSRTMDPLQVGATVTPAPTAYDAHGGVGTQAAGGAQLGFAQQSGRKELHPVNADTALLAPGSYDTPDTWGQGRAATITARTLDPLRVGATVTPAPGSYDVNQQHHSSAQGQPSFGLQSGRAELFTVNHQQPAPGQYTLPDTIGQGPAASMRSRTEVADQRLQYPGVGQYEVAAASEAASSFSSSSSAVGFAGHAARSELFAVDASAPAPGAYSLPSSLGSGPAASLRARTADPLSVGATVTPGPASYDVRYPAEQVDRDFTFGGVYRPSANLRQFMDGQADGGWMRTTGEQRQAGGAVPRPSGDGETYNSSGPGLLD